MEHKYLSRTFGEKNIAHTTKVKDLYRGANVSRNMKKRDGNIDKKTRNKTGTSTKFCRGNES